MLLASGMAAATSVFLALKPGDHVVAPQVMYWALRRWLTSFATDWGLAVDLVDATSPDAIAAAIRPGQPRPIWIETPGNPPWAAPDIGPRAESAHPARD